MKEHKLSKSWDDVELRPVHFSEVSGVDDDDVAFDIAAPLDMEGIPILKGEPELEDNDVEFEVVVSAFMPASDDFPEVKSGVGAIKKGMEARLLLADIDEPDEEDDDGVVDVVVEQESDSKLVGKGKTAITITIKSPVAVPNGKVLEFYVDPIIDGDTLHIYPIPIRVKRIKVNVELESGEIRAEFSSVSNKKFLDLSPDTAVMGTLLGRSKQSDPLSLHIDSKVVESVYKLSGYAELELDSDDDVEAGGGSVVDESEV